MPGSVTFYLPLATSMTVQSFANAAYAQRVTITPETGPVMVFQGSGYYDTPIGQTLLATPSSGSSPEGFRVTVNVDHSSDGVNWQPSDVDWMTIIVKYTSIYFVVSEDSADDTWDDATTYFTWTTPPPPN
jgi:hypothetical protein